MSQLSKKWQQLYPSDQLLLVIRAAQLTSDAALFQRLMHLLDQTIKCSPANIDQQEIKARLQAIDGTELEPFTLNERNIELASRLAQLAFSDRYAQSRIRVISEQSVGCRGGLVLGADGKDEYVERFLRKDDSFDYRDCWFWAPSSPIPTYLMDIEIKTAVKACEQAPFFIEAEVRPGKSIADPSAFRSPGIKSLLGWEQERIEASVVNGKSTVPLQLQVSIESNAVKKSASSPDRLLIKPTSPESIMRFSALLASGSVLQVDSMYGGSGNAQLKIRLALPEGSSTVLPTEIRWTAALFDEVSKVPHDVPMPLNNHDLTAVLGELSLKSLPSMQERKAA